MVVSRTDGGRNFVPSDYLGDWFHRGFQTGGLTKPSREQENDLMRVSSCLTFHPHLVFHVRVL